MSEKFKTKPSGVVTLWRISDRTLTSHIQNVYGYDAELDAWQVAIHQTSPPQGQWSGSETVYVRQCGDDWLLVQTPHQNPAFASGEHFQAMSDLTAGRVRAAT